MLFLQRFELLCFLLITYNLRILYQREKMRQFGVGFRHVLSAATISKRYVLSAAYYICQSQLSSCSRNLARFGHLKLVRKVT